MNKITQEEFDREYRTLCKMLGVAITNVREDQIIQWYDLFRYEQVGVIRLAFKMAASRTSRSFPTLAEVRECLRPAKERELSKMKERTSISCRICDDNGTVIGTDNLAYRCVCDAGERFTKNFRVIPRQKIQPVDPELPGRELPAEVAIRCMEVIRESLRLRRSGDATWSKVREVLEEVGHLPRRVSGAVHRDTEGSLEVVSRVFKGSSAVPG